MHVQSLAALLAFISTLPQISSQSPVPTMADCGPQLLALLPCTPFVQGLSPAPTQQCCDSLKMIYSQQPACLCLFMTGIALRSLPFNTTLALELPHICSSHMNPSICSGAQMAPPLQADPALFGANSSSPSIAVPSTPTVTVTPIPSTLLGFGRSASCKLNQGVYLTMMLAATIIQLTNKILSYLLE